MSIFSTLYGSLVIVSLVAIYDMTGDIPKLLQRNGDLDSIGGLRGVEGDIRAIAHFEFRVSTGISAVY